MTGGEGTAPPVRVLVAKAGLDGHDRGAKIIVRALRDAGMEVIYSGLHRTPESIVRTAVDEDVRFLGLSVLSGAHMTIFPEVIALLAAEGAADVVVFGGGIIPDEDAAVLRSVGVAEIFAPGTATDEVVRWVRARAAGPPG